MSLGKPTQAAALAAVLLGAAVTPLVARTLLPMPYKCPPCERVANGLARADVGPGGTWVLGTTGGDPDTALDDDKTLLYGFWPAGQSVVGSGYTTIRVSGPAGTFDRVPADAAAQVVLADSIATVWRGPAPYTVLVTETVQLRQNQFSGRADAAEVCFEAGNQDRVPLSVGLRTLLDVKLGDNDGAPYFVPGVGAVTSETEFSADAVPAFWVAFESPTYDPQRLRTVGILRGPDVTPPDRFLIADWVRIQHEDWDYGVRPTTPVTRDSAVALYWNPRALAPGERWTMCSRYGLASNRGGSAFLTAPVEAQCDSTVTAAVFVNNFEPTPFTGGRATIQLPAGLELAPGEQAAKPMATIAPGATGSAQWQVVIKPGTAGDRLITASVAFDGNRRFETDSQLTVTCTPPTETPPPSPTPSPTATLTPSPTPDVTPNPYQPNVCDFILGRVPAAVITWALANPHLVHGWGELANPNAPRSPFNQPRTWLSLQNIAAPFHRLQNSVTYKAGCP